MAGGLMQLVAYGAQDVYLTGNPKVTFFQAVYKKHTNFAMETIEQTVNGTSGNSGRISVTIARNGDLVGDMYIELTPLATLKLESNNSVADAIWCAERAINNIELTIGGQRIDKHYQRWWRLYSELYLDDAKKVNWGKMTSASDNNNASSPHVFLPLIFFFNRNPGLFLPLIALQYHEVRLDIDISGVYDSHFTGTPKIWANYVYLDTEERRRFAQKGHEYLIEQVQHTGVDTIENKNSQVRLSYNHPIKELVWCYANASGDVGNTNALWNFTGPSASNVTLTVNPQHSPFTQDSNTKTTVCQFLPHHVSSPHMVCSSNLTVDTAYGYWAEEGNMSKISVGPLETFKLILNGQDRFKEQSGKYFNQVQPFNYHTGTPYPGIYCYSFALKPEEHQPSGTCNFSRIDNAQTAVKLKASVFSASQNAQHMFAVNYNVLRIQSGMGGLAFSN
jgi:hypothetical protein